MRSRTCALLTSLVTAAGLAGTALGSAPASVSAQGAGSPQAHHGFWLSGGLGGGWTSHGGGGGGAYIRLGGTLSQKFVIGGEAIGWGRDTNGGTVSRGNAVFDVLYYPSTTSGGFLKAGVGFANFTREITDPFGGTLSSDRQGAGAVLGAGWDIHLGGGNLYLTPNVDVLLQGYDNLSRVDAVYLFTLGIGFH
ncbi:MAG: hypothetical protein Q8W51_05690 [Candidatus Palauibacterales bacterium]|nr:hypothetical protein [Candidatus Palauibacterales bacterium]MDP2529209.1 hypothetical protein [Candidatus Palauibacterales bacterium]MDP2583662.1 hypothetical protein [Candidatus Palauibacterales bacterium]